MTPEEILRDISRTVQKGIETNGTTSTGISSEEHIYRLSSSSSSVIGKDSVTVNPVNLKLYSKPGYANPSVPSFKTSYQCLHEGKTLLLKSVAKSQEKHRKHEQCNKIPAIFLVPHCNSIHTAHTVSNYNTKSVENTNDKDDNRLIKIRDNLQDIEHNKMVPRIEHTQDKICYNSDEPVYSTVNIYYSKFMILLLIFIRVVHLQRLFFFSLRPQYIVVGVEKKFPASFNS